MNNNFENPRGVEKAEIVVGIPSYNEADSISFVVSRVDKALSTFFPQKDTVIINVDNHSPDNTKKAFMDTVTKTPKIYASTRKGVKGKGRNIKNLFELSVELGARATVMVDADLKSITPSWIRLLTEPIYMSYDYVIPIYVRHKYDGTITNNITYPLTRVLYGLRTRQPIAGDFAFSGRMARAYLTEKSWNKNVLEYGIDIWMTTNAIVRGFRVCQAFLGATKQHRARDPGAELGSMFYQVIGTVFSLAIDFEYLWKDNQRSVPTNIFGFGLGVKEDPPMVKVNKNTLHQNFLKGEKDHGHMWREALDPCNFEDLEKLKETDVDNFCMPADMWARILFDFIVAYRDESKAKKPELLASLVPIYFARTLGYVNDTRKMDTKEAEEFLENECRVMEGEKFYLITKWNQTPRKDGIPSIAQYLTD